MSRYRDYGVGFSFRVFIGGLTSNLFLGFMV
jgi:hypothetical protein